MDPKKLGRYSFIGYDPFLIFRSKRKNIEIIRNNKIYQLSGNPLDELKSLLSKYKVDYYSKKFPFVGGAVGYFSYDLYESIYKIKSNQIDDINTWDCYLGFYDTILMFDNIEKSAYVVSCSDYIKKFDSPKKIFMKKKSNIVVNKNSNKKTRIISNFTKKDYIKSIKKVKEYIKAGDIYQANLSQRLCTDLNTDPWILYKKLHKINPAPFSAFLNFDGITIASSSPERFLKVDKRRIETRPIKGTRPRGKNLEEDKKLAKELMNSEKDKAEHVMIVDLERNDLGKICKFGSVKVSEFEILEKYTTVFHMVSTVEGKLKKDVDQIDCLKATFPGGSITGAPKVRSMEIISELEPTRRSIYTGSLGYLSFNGNMDLNIVIRTFIIKDNKGYFQVGGGIVADSDPEKEYDETLDKAKALIESCK